MSLLSVTVKKAQLSGAQAAAHNWNSYVTLKLQHVKSTTVTVKGSNPSWEQDFLFEVNNLDAGLLLEVWSKGVIWDKAVGYNFIHLRDIQHSNVESTGQWFPLEAELVMRDGEVVGTKTATGHAILIDARFELPYANDMEGEEGVELQRKLVMLNSMLDQEARAEQARKQHQYYIQSGISEDSDYTSDVNYPIGQHPNSSASQFLSAANQLSTPQRSLSSRENSYEKDDEYYRANGSNQQNQYYPPYPHSHARKQLPTLPTQHFGSRSANRGGYWDDPRDQETDPLYYNSRPQNNYKSRHRRRGSWDDEYQNQKRPEYSRQYEENYRDAQEYSQPSQTYSKTLKNNRRRTPSLERQYTLYDETGDYVADEEIQEGNSKTVPYVNDPYSSNQQNAHTNSVYNDYNQDYNAFSSEMVYDDEYADPQTSSYDPYAKESSYDYNEWNDENDTRDQYSAAVTAKSSKELPVHDNRNSQLSSQSPFNSQSTVKEVSVAPPTVQPVIPPLHDHPSSKYAINTSGYGHVDEDCSFYDATNYNNHAQVDHTSSLARSDATVPIVTANNDQTEQYMDSYENQAEYEDWQNYGYYDEAGNYIQYDQSSYYQDETGNLLANDVQSQSETAEKDAYSSYYDPPQNRSTNFEVPSADTTTKVIVHQEPSAVYNEQYDDPNYYTTSGADQQYPTYDQTTQGDYGSYDQDGYWYDATTDTGKTVLEPEQTPVPDLKTLPQSELQSNAEYNYAYQSAENLATHEPAHAKLDKSESVSRRASFRRQASTRGDYHDATPPSAMPPTQFEANHVAVSRPYQVITATTSATTPHTTTAPSNTAAIAAAAASKLTSEIKSALPQLTSLTKGKADLFSSSFSKLGNFVSNAAAKTGVTVPTMTANKEKVTLPQPAVVVSVTQDNQVHPEMSMDHGYEYPVDEQYQYDQWNEYDEHNDPYLDYNKTVQDDSYEHYDGTEEQEGDFKDPVPHMDSLESNISEGARDGEDLEAEYWQKQQERIAKQSSLQAQESQDFYPPYDSFDNTKPNLLQSMDLDSADDKGFPHSEFRQNSLDRDEWLKELEKQSGSQIRPSLNKKDTMSMSLDRSESIDQDGYYGDEYGTDQDHARRQESLESGEEGGYPMMSPPPKTTEEEIMQEGPRKSSLDILLKEKGNKSVSFEEEPPKLLPERQTKGMTAREKWLWAINRICAQLAVRIYFPLLWSAISFEINYCSACLLLA